MTGRRLTRTVVVSGRGLHSGEPSSVRIRPSGTGRGPSLRAGPGVVRVDPAAADPGAVRCTILRVGDRGVSTVEHLLAAIAGTGAWDVEVEVDGPEVPILDGSALPWAEEIMAASEPCEMPRQERLGAAARLWAGTAAYRIEPAGRPEVTVTISGVPHGPDALRVSWNGDPEVFVRDFAPARTFALLDEVDGILRAGLAKGADASCAVVIGPEGPVMGGPLRFPDEPVRHKLVDLVGDLALLGAPLAARVTALSPHHAANRMLAAFAACISANPTAGGRPCEPVRKPAKPRFPCR